MDNETSIAPINENLDVVEYEIEDIKKKIYTIRGNQVMSDSDVAMLYNCETKYVNRVVKRNIERFPEEFCFQLTETETKNLRCQFVTSSLELKYGGRRYLPYVFDEQGIAMLSVLLKSEIAIKVSINIMKAFIEMRKFIAENAQIFERLTNVEYKLLQHDKKFDEVFNQLGYEENIKQKIFFEGQIYDAYSLIIDLIRFIIIDNKELYHCGASIKDLGKKCFGINKIEDISIIGKLLN